LAFFYRVTLSSIISQPLSLCDWKKISRKTQIVTLLKKGDWSTFWLKVQKARKGWKACKVSTFNWDRSAAATVSGQGKLKCGGIYCFHLRYKRHKKGERLARFLFLPPLSLNDMIQGPHQSESIRGWNKMRDLVFFNKPRAHIY
jgi:hypothetical protein